ncbi:MAG: hypothetical protein ACX939_06630 [Hyphococcus sp.]
MSLYQLTIEPGTAFETQTRAGRWAPAEDSACADQFDLAQEMTATAGLPAYEISNHAAPGAQSRHNLLYWRYQDYIGVGPGAHGRLTTDETRIATETPLRPEDYLAGRASANKTGFVEETLDDGAQLVERLSMGLRLHEGITLYADDPFYADDARAKNLERAQQDGLVTLACGRLKATADGRRMLNRLLYDLLG